MKKLISMLLVLVAISGVSAELVELSYFTSVDSSNSNTFQRYDTILYTLRYDTELPAEMVFYDSLGSHTERFSEFVDEFGISHQAFYAEIISSAFVDDENVTLATVGDQYFIGVNVTGADNSIVDAFFYLGSEYHTINIYTASHDTTGTDNGINSWASDTSLNLKIFETIARSENDTGVLITHFPIRVKPVPPPTPLPPPPSPQNVPEPSVATSLCLGILVLSGTAVRRCLQKKR
jgi:hypothetical protein